VSTLYAESSVVLAWLFGEPGSSGAMKRINEADTIATSALTLLEIERALIRAEKQDLLRAGECQRLRGMLARAARSWILMEVSEEVRAGAGRVFPVEPVRTLDALHLSTALLLMQAFPDLQMLTFDQRIAANSRALGMD
jgi:predicted nucleic acid-binding protein